MARNQKGRGRKKKFSTKGNVRTNGLPANPVECQPKSPRALNQMEDLLLARVLILFPLQQLVPLRTVCKQWQSVIETELFASIVHLKLYGYKMCDLKRDEDDLKITKRLANEEAQDALSVRSLNRTSVLLIKRWFPNLQELYFLNNLLAPDNLVWTTELTLSQNHGALYRFDPRMGYRENLQKPQAMQLCRMRALQQLWNPIGLAQGSGSSCLRHLEKFHIELFYLSDIYSSLLVNANKLTSLSITRNSWCSKSTLDKLSPTCAKTLTHLSIDSDRSGIGGVDLPFLDSVCTHFVNLTFLDIQSDETCKIHHVLKRLVKLAQLNSLVLTSNASNFFYPRSSISSVPPLNSIKKLRLSSEFSIKYVRIIQRLFPNLESICINLLSTSCRCLRQPTCQMFGKMTDQTICRNCGEMLPQLLRERCPFLSEITFENMQVISTDDRAVNEQYKQTKDQLNVELFPASFQPMARILHSSLQSYRREQDYDF